MGTAQGDGIMIIVLSILAIAFFFIALFLGKEMMKKFGFMNTFIENSGQLFEYRFPGQEKPDMGNIVLVAKKPFTALVGFRLEVPLFGKGFDYYGVVKSGEDGTAVISTFLGKKPVCFQFFTNTDNNPVTIYGGDYDHYEPDAVFPPHWYQRLGFYS